MSNERMRELVSSLAQATTALAALGAALEMRSTTDVADPTIAHAIAGVLRGLGAPDLLDGVDPTLYRPLAAEIRLTFLQSLKLLTSSLIRPGWTHTEADLLQSQGEASAAFAVAFKRTVIPLLDGLAERLVAPTASFLDVGVGVAALAIAMAHHWPALRVVGIDPWEPALALADQNVAGAGLSDRIELRRQGVEEISDVAAFDLVWFSGPFIPPDRLLPALERVRYAMRPGGWILSGSLNRAGGPLAEAVADLRTVLWGGQPRTPAEDEDLLRATGFSHVRALPSPPWALAALVVGQRPLTDAAPPS